MARRRHRDQGDDHERNLDQTTARGPVSPPAGVAVRFYRLRPLGVFAIAYNGSNFTYTDADRTITGLWFEPSGTGLFPGCIVSHGQGGSAAGYSAAKLTSFSPGDSARWRRTIRIKLMATLRPSCPVSRRRISHAGSPAEIFSRPCRGWIKTASCFGATAKAHGFPSGSRV